MADKYRVIPLGPAFLVSNDAGGMIGVFKTEQEAQQGVEDCQQEDSVLATAINLVEKATDKLMRTHHMDHQTARDWIKEAVR